MPCCERLGPRRSDWCAREIGHVGRAQDVRETAQHTTCGSRKCQMVLVRAFNHRCLQGGLHINATGAKRRDERLPHGIFVKVEAHGHGVFHGGDCCMSRCCASASSTLNLLYSWGNKQFDSLQDRVYPGMHRYRRDCMAARQGTPGRRHRHPVFPLVGMLW